MVNTWGNKRRVCKSKTGRCLELRAALFPKEWGKLLGYMLACSSVSGSAPQLLFLFLGTADVMDRMII